MTRLASPIYFGPPERPLAGWLHLPRDAGSALGLIICNPFGYEMICAQRALRRLAEMAAASGIPTLRFDYDGTGDSAGGDLDDHRVEQWTLSVKAAVATLQLHAGTSQICLLGLRLGALIAGLALHDLEQVMAFVGLAPVVDGRRYLRELRTFKAAVEPEEIGEGLALESGGFVLTAQTADALTAAKLTDKGFGARVQTLIVDRGDLPSAAKWRDQLTAASTPVDYRTSTEFGALLTTPHNSVVPQAVLDDVLGWLQPLKAAAGPMQALADGKERPRCVRIANADGSIVEEQAIDMRPDGSLFGILSMPHSAGGTQKARRAVLLLNAGASYHVGPNRMYVEFARTWAARGDWVLRLDISGLGESAARTGEAENIVYSRSALEDISDAIRHVRDTCGAQHIVLVGLCSGAYHALKIAAAGLPVQRVIMINPLVFFWHEGMSLDTDELQPYQIAGDAMDYRRKAFQRNKWLKLLKGRVNVSRVLHVLALRGMARLRSWSADVARVLHLPMKDDLGHELRLIAARKQRMAFVFAVGEPGLDLLKLQAGSVLGRIRDACEIHTIERATHTFTSRSSRLRLLSLLDAEIPK